VRDPGISAISGRALRFELGQKCFSGRNFSRRGAEIHTLAADFVVDRDFIPLARNHHRHAVAK
jgi:hypothetical protein